LSASSDDPRSVKFIAMLPDPHHFVPVSKASTFIVVQLHASEKKSLHRDTSLAKEELHRNTPRQEGVAQTHPSPRSCTEIHPSPRSCTDTHLAKKELPRVKSLAKKGLHRDTHIAKELHRDTPLTVH
jgi:hypothetical protein